MEPESAFRTDPAEMTVAGQLDGALAQVAKISTQLEVLQLHIENAIRCAEVNLWPRDDLDEINREVDALRELLGEKVEQVIRRLALEETGSRAERLLVAPNAAPKSKIPEAIPTARAVTKLFAYAG